MKLNGYKIVSETAASATLRAIRKIPSGTVGSISKTTSQAGRDALAKAAQSAIKSRAATSQAGWQKVGGFARSKRLGTAFGVDRAATTGTTSMFGS